MSGHPAGLPHTPARVSKEPWRRLDDSVASAGREDGDVNKTPLQLPDWQHGLLEFLCTGSRPGLVAAWCSSYNIRNNNIKFPKQRVEDSHDEKNTFFSRMVTGHKCFFLRMPKSPCGKSNTGSFFFWWFHNHMRWLCKTAQWLKSFSVGVYQYRVLFDKPYGKKKKNNNTAKILLK